MKRTIDINCDMGESFGRYTLGQDESMLDYITSANIACGFHAGDPSTMDLTVKLAVHKGVAIGAHPSLPDLAGFGRRVMQIEPEDVYRLTIYQLGALDGFARVHGQPLQHVKPHGALYNMAASDRAIARAIASAVAHYDRNLILFGLAGSVMIEEGMDAGLKTASEVFADRTYQPDGSLTPRSRVDAMVKDHQEAARRVVRMIMEQKTEAVDGTIIPIIADTVCIHGDEPEALHFVQTLRSVLHEQGIELKPAGQQ